MHTNNLEKSINWSKMGRYLLNFIPMTKLNSSTWLYPTIVGEDVEAGYKLHIPFCESDDPIEFANMILEIYSMNINFKICQNINVINTDSIQKGKHLVLYPNNLCFLSLLSEKSKKILFDVKDAFVPNEYQIEGTRIFTRFCHFRDETYFCFDSFEFLVAKKGDSLPYFTKLPNNSTIFDLNQTKNNQVKILSDMLSIAAERYRKYKEEGDFESSSRLLEMYKPHFEKLWQSVVIEKNTPIFLINYSLLVKLAVQYGKIQF